MHTVLFKYPRFYYVRDEVIALQQHFGLHQMSIQTNGSTDWNQSCGWLAKGNTEQMFSQIHEQLKGSEIHKYLEWLPFPVFRTRIMVMTPGRQYSIHKDPTRRLHLPLVTNEKAEFIFTEDEFRVHMPADGRLHVVDTRRSHTATNGGEQNRIHIVSVIPNEINLDQFLTDISASK